MSPMISRYFRRRSQPVERRQSVKSPSPGGRCRLVEPVQGRGDLVEPVRPRMHNTATHRPVIGIDPSLAIIEQRRLLDLRGPTHDDAVALGLAIRIESDQS